MGEKWSIFTPEQVGFQEFFTESLKDLYQRFLDFKEGENATYIPDLATADPDWFGISIMTTDGQVYSIGDTAELLTIQSISQPLVYGMVLEEWGEEYVLNKIGVEPTGEPFNDIMEAQEIKDRKYNPMVNAGALITTSLIKGKNLEEKRHKLLTMFSRYFGRDVNINDSIFGSRKTGDSWNRAIAYMMLNFGLIEGNVEEILDLYFQQCSISVNCQDLALMAATLANQGLNPLTGERTINENFSKNLLSVMFSSGLYDFSGQWAYRVGLPAKSS